jgi:hypothetical protein
MSDPGHQRQRHLSSFHLELARLGQTSPGERAFIDEHLRGCAACSEMAASFEGHRRGFLATGASEAGARARAREGLGRARRRRLFAWLATGLLLPVAAALVLFLAPRRGARDGGVGLDPDVAVKGGPTPGLMVAARRGARVFPVSPSEPLRPGDQIRFVLERVRHRYVLIASVDGAGRANIYVPYEGSASLDVGAGDRVEIPGSIVVDDVPGPERLFALVSARPIDAASVRAALANVGARGPSAVRDTRRLDVGADDQVSMLLEKVVP